MALPRIGGVGNDAMDGRLDYFSKVSELIQGDEHRRQRKRQERGSDSDPVPDTARARALKQSASVKVLPTVPHSFQQSASAPYLPSVAGSQQRTYDTRSNDPFPRATARDCQTFHQYHPCDSPPINQLNRSHYPAVGSHSTFELPSIQSQGGSLGAVGNRLSTPSHRNGIPEAMAPTPSNRNAAFFGRQLGPGTPCVRNSIDATGMLRSESSDELLHHRQGQLPARMMGVHNSIDCSGTATTLHQAALQTGGRAQIGRVASLPSLQGGGDTQRHSWNPRLGSSDSTASTAASTPDIPQQPASASTCPWAAPWKPIPAPDLEPVVNRVPSFPTPPVPPVPIRGVPSEQTNAAASPWAAPWQPRAAADTVLAPLGELPPVAELSERSSQVSSQPGAYPASLSSRPESKTGGQSIGSSPFRSPVSGIGPPTPDACPPVGSVESILDAAKSMVETAKSIVESAKTPTHAEAAQRQAMNSYSMPPMQMSMNVGMNMPPSLDMPHASSPLGRPTANYSPELCHSSAGLHPFAAELSKPPPPLQEPQAAASNAQDYYPSSPVAMHHRSAVDCSPMCSPGVPASVNSTPYHHSTYPPSPGPLQPLARGNDRPPRSPLRRKESMQRTKSMGAVPVLGPLPSLSYGRM